MAGDRMSGWNDPTWKAGASYDVPLGWRVATVNAQPEEEPKMTKDQKINHFKAAFFALDRAEHDIDHDAICNRWLEAALGHILDAMPPLSQGEAK